MSNQDDDQFFKQMDQDIGIDLDDDGDEISHDLADLDELDDDADFGDIIEEFGMDMDEAEEFQSAINRRGLAGSLIGVLAGAASGYWMFGYAEPQAGVWAVFLGLLLGVAVGLITVRLVTGLLIMKYMAN